MQPFTPLRKQPLRKQPPRGQPLITNSTATYFIFRSQPPPLSASAAICSHPPLSASAGILIIITSADDICTVFCP